MKNGDLLNGHKRLYEKASLTKFHLNSIELFLSFVVNWMRA